jgi:3-dehydroquinate dehydratase-2
MGLAKLLVLHGPHLDLLGKGPLAAQTPLTEVERAMARAALASADLRFAQGNTEGELVKALHASRDWASHVLVSPGALAPTAHVLREALALCALPFGELFLEALPDSATHARDSVLRERAALQRRGTVPAVYLEAMQALMGVRTSPTPVVKSIKEIGRAKARVAAVSAHVPATKTIGRRGPKPAHGAPVGLTREVVRNQIAARLAGKLGAQPLAAWAKEQWLALERGGSDIGAERERLAGALQALALSATAGGQLSEAELLSWMTRLD